MKRHGRSIVLLMAEDDPDDQLLVEEAFAENHFINEVRFVEDGEALMDYLYQQGKYEDRTLSPRPDLILLDLNMPRKDGRQALREIKSDPELRDIPVVILTTSKERDDILRSYELGANSFITKPVTFEGLLDAIDSFGKYWFQTVELPPEKGSVS